jgi:hypothetical protein
LGIKKEIRKHYYKQELRKKRKNKAFISFNQAKTFGILYHADSKKMKLLAHKLVEVLQGHHKDVQSFGFVNAKKFHDNLHIRYGYEYFNRSHLNWLGVPTHSHIYSFTEKEYDYLINLDTDTLLISLLAAKSQAKCKITTSNTEFEETYDFMLTTQEGDFIAQLLHYLQKIG